MIKAYVEKIDFRNGPTVKLSANSICLVVGPNNSGKTAALSDIYRLVEDDRNLGKVVEKLSLRRVTTLEGVKAHFLKFRDHAGSYRAPGIGFHESHLNAWWGPSSTSINQLIGSVISFLGTRERLADCDPPGAFDAREAGSATHPFQRMYQDDTLEVRASDIFRSAFKADLIVHRAASDKIPIYVGERPKLAKGEDRTSRSYLDRLEKLDRLELQGDGIRSFTSVTGRVLTEDRPILLIDEPEAFLHPPQARLIASVISRETPRRQTFIATHSSEVLQGLLANHASRVSVVRVTRPSGVGRATHLASNKIAELWSDPILRFGKALDGLFHDGVILTEADADCRFYEAIADAALQPSQRPDIHYAYSGGKERLPTLIGALRGLHVPVATIVDFDVLNGEVLLKKIIKAHGGDWPKFESDWKDVRAAVESSAAFLSSDKFRTQIAEALRGYGSGVAVPSETLRDVRRLTKSASPWDNVKTVGLGGLARGEPTRAAKRLLNELKGVGIFVVPQGELEGFYRSAAGHGPRWMAQVLQLDLAHDPDLAAAREFMRSVFGYLRDKQAP